MRTLRDLEVAGKTVLVRADFNVPLSGDGEITDDTRITATLPTLEELWRLGASRLVLASHLGRPKGKYDPKLTLRPIAGRIAELLHREVVLLPVDLAEAQVVAQAAPEGAVLLLENTRFYDGEERNDPDLAHSFASLADAFVNDAFGAAHRAHASTEGVAHLLPSAAGLLLEREVVVLRRLLQRAEAPFVAILGGAKVSDKLQVIENLLPRVDALLIGGAMANTFLLSQGKEVGKSLTELDQLGLALGLLEGPSGDKLILPVDVVVAQSLDAAETATVVSVDQVASDVAIYDIGPATAELYSNRMQGARTVFWNGPMGVFEREGFDRGTYAIAEAVAACGAYSVVGGGDSVAAVKQAGVAERIDHISTGGGASLELLEGKQLPGVIALEDGVA